MCCPGCACRQTAWDKRGVFVGDDIIVLACFQKSSGFEFSPKDEKFALIRCEGEFAPSHFIMHFQHVFRRTNGYTHRHGHARVCAYG